METIEAVLAAHPFFQGMTPQHSDGSGRVRPPGGVYGGRFSVPGG